MYYPDGSNYYRPVYNPMYGGYVNQPMMGPTQMQHSQALAHQVLTEVHPLVGYMFHEQKIEGASLPHAIYEIAAIAYLMGKGYPYQEAHRIVESWEIGEKFPTER